MEDLKKEIEDLNKVLNDKEIVVQQYEQDFKTITDNLNLAREDSQSIRKQISDKQAELFRIIQSTRESI